MIYEVSFCKNAGNSGVDYNELVLNMLVNCQLYEVGWEDYDRTENGYKVYYKYKHKEVDDGQGEFEGFEI